VKLATLCAISLLLSIQASASDCSISKEFKVNGSQAVAGVLKDPANLPVSGLLMELLEAKTVVRQFRADNDGRFELGLLTAGNYRLRIVSEPFCAPRIQCFGQDCTVAGTLRLNERKAKPVTVY